MVRIEPCERAESLLSPVEALLVRALSALPDAPALGIQVGSLPEGSLFALSGDAVTLSEDLCGPALSHPSEQPGPLPPFDRWRRSCGCVIEAACLRELSRRTSQPPGTDWRWVGGAIALADRLAPELNLDLPDVALAIGTGSPGSYPRAGAAVMRAWRAFGLDPAQRVEALLAGGILSAIEWLKIGAWVLSPEGAASLLPVAAPRVAELALPAEIPPWSWRPLRLGPGPRGMRLETSAGAIDTPWVVGGQPAVALAAATDAASTVFATPGGPVGLWTVASAEGFGSVMGARGIQFHFREDGRLELVLADAFVGPLAAVAMADQVGTSGLCAGTWSVAGERKLRFSKIDARALTLHGRSRDRFLVPARGFGLGEWIEALAEDLWEWQLAGPSDPDRLVMRGRMLGGGVEVRLRRAQSETITA